MNLVDTTNCELEPIRYPGAVQPHGALLVLAAESDVIEAASDSCKALLGLSAENLLGQSAASIVGRVAAAALRSAQADGVQPLIPLTFDGQSLAARAHRNQAGQIVVDIEAEAQDSVALREMIYAGRNGLAALRRLSDIATVTHQAAVLFRRIAGFDRVMIYRFDEAWNGEVIAEACADGVEPYLGLRYPASDIPRQARELFQSSGVRQIPDALYAPSALIARADGRTFDLGRSSLRSVSPLHIEYLKNMEVRATLVGSLIVDGRLWGLISCQNKDTPKVFGPAARDALGWLCEDIAALLTEAQLRQRREREDLLKARRRQLIEMLRGFDFRTLMRAGGGKELLGVVDADGFALVIDDEIHTAGITPEPGRIRELQQRRGGSGRNPTFYASHALSRDLGVTDTGDGVAGGLFVAVPNKPAITMIWFRREQHYSLHWGGDPNQAHVADASGRVSPRKSFAKFLQEVRGQAPAWSAEELDSAADLGALVEIEALREREVFSQTILDSNPAHVCVLDSQGVIVTVNNSWRRFAEANGASEFAAGSVGLNYQNICSAATGQPSGTEAGAAWVGIKAVLDKRLDQFILDYPCDSPSEQRWFRMRVYALNAPCEGVVVAHENVTAGKLAEKRIEQESAKNQALLRNASDGIHILDLAGNVVDVSDSFCTMLGYQRAEIIAMKVSQWDAQFPSENFAPGISQHYAQQVRTQFETRHRRKDGSIFDVEVSGIPLELDGKPVMFYSARDISERKQAEVALAGSEAQLKNAQRIARVGNWEHDLAADTVLWSDEMYRIYGLARQSATPTPESLSVTIHPDDRSATAQSYANALNSRSAFDLTHRVNMPGGETKYVHVLGEPHFAADRAALRFVGTAQDVTQLVQQEQTLRFSEARLRSVFDAMAEGLVLQSEDGKITDANLAAESILGLSRDELLGRVSLDPRWQATHEDGSPFPGDQHPSMVTLRTGQAMRNQVMAIDAPRLGSRLINVNSQPIFASNAPTPKAVVATFTDITERYRTLATLHENEERFRQAFARSPVGIVLCNLDGYVFKANAAFCRMSGYTEEEIVGHRFGDLMLRPDAAAEESELFRRIACGEISEFSAQQEYAHKDGHFYLAANSISAISDSTGTPLYCIAHLEDLSERQRRQLEALAKQTLKAQEDERARLSRELHDEIGQSLTALKLTLQRAQGKGAKSMTLDCLRDATEATQTLMETVRGIAYRLRPAQLDDLGLMPSLRWYLDKVIRPTGLPYILAGNLDEERFPADLELCCFRVAQEALNNIMKHARATTIEVSLYRTGNLLTLELRDNGVGFDVAKYLLAPDNTRSLGLIGMRERVASAGGRLQVNSKSGQGTEIRADFPLSGSMR